MRRTNGFIVAVAVASLSFCASVRGGAPYWWTHSLVFAEVKSTSISSIPGNFDKKMVIRPLGTLSGRFDAGAVAEMTVDFLARGGTVVKEVRDEFPNVGDKILLILTQNPEGEGRYTTALEITGYMPGVDHHTVRIVNDFEDQEVSATLAAVRSFHQQFDGKEDPRWQNFEEWVPRIVICATVEGVPSKSEMAGPGNPTLALQMLRSLSNERQVDVPRFIAAEVRAPIDVNQVGTILKMPPVDSTVIVTLEVSKNSSKFFLRPYTVGFMPGDRSPICQIQNIDDRRIGEVESAIREWQFWKTHCLICAYCDGTIETADRVRRIDFSLLPRVTLSGNFDCGKVPRLTASISQAENERGFKTPSVGSTVLVLLATGKGSYNITPKTAEFMPGDHLAICEIKGFSDPKVIATLAAVRKRRRADFGIEARGTGGAAVANPDSAH